MCAFHKCTYTVLSCLMIPLQHKVDFKLRESCSWSHGQFIQGFSLGLPVDHLVQDFIKSFSPFFQNVSSINLETKQHVGQGP